VSHSKVNQLAVFLGVAQIYAWGSTYYLPATLVQPVSEQLGISHMAVVGGFSLALLVGGLLAPMIGRWIERTGGRNLLSVGSVLAGLGLLMLSVAKGVVLWYLGWTVVGLGMALTLFNAVFSTLGQLFGHKAKDLIIKVTLISGLATFFWPVTTHLIEAYGWRAMLVIYALPHLFVLAPLYRFLIPESAAGTASKSEPPPLAGHEKAQVILYLLAGFAILRTLVGSAMSVHVLNVFHEIGLTAERAAVVAAFIGPGQIAGRLVEFFFSHRISPLSSAIFWSAVLPTSLLALILAGAPATVPFAIAYGMSNGMATISLSVLLMTYFDIKKYPTLMGKIALPSLVTQASAPLLAASFLDAMPVNRVLYLTLFVSFAAVLFLVFIRQINLPSKKLLESG
jgi:predicted MFS family arabinose efflux permease